MEYPKINSLWKRDPATHKFLFGELSCKEFLFHLDWDVEEKIDGMNIRIYFQAVDGEEGTQGYKFDIKGRTAAANSPKKLEDWIYGKGLEKGLSELGLRNGVLYGEGFGPGIQSGGIYRSDMAFILFDCYTNRWSTREEITQIATALNIDRTPQLGKYSIKEIISKVLSRPKGHYGKCDYTMEGIVARSRPLVRFNNPNADPLMFKLKVKDFEGETAKNYFQLLKSHNVSRWRRS